MGQFSDDSVSGLSKISSIKIPQQAGSNTWRMPSAFDAQNGSNDTSLFSCSLPLLPHEKLNFADAESFVQSIDDASSKFSTWHVDMEVKEAMEDHEPNALGNLLPDDEDELLAGIMDDFDLSRLPSQVDDLDEDLFGSGGGLELDFDPPESMSVGFAKPSIHDGYAGTGSGTGHYGLPNGIGTIAGEHPYGEHPSRTLFVRNINSTVEDSEVRALFEQYGEIRTLYTACKHRGFVMISYYDIRAARTAMRALQNKPLRRRKLDIHFSIPKDNPSEKDMNQGTLVAFNLDSSVSNDDLCQIFGAYGEVKEIRETPHKRHHKFIEFYDVRAAEAALRSLNRIDIAGKRIKLEPSRPGGARRNLMQQWPQELEHDENRALRTQVGSPITNSPPGSWAQYSSSSEKSSLQSFSHSPNYGTVSPMSSNYLPGLGSILPPRVSNSVKIAPIGRDQSRISNNDQVFAHTGSANSAAFQHSYLFPERSSGMMPNMSQSPGSMSSCTHSNTSGIGTLTGPQFLWGSPAVYSEHAHSSAWPTSATGQSFTSNGQGQGFPHSSCQSSFVGLSHHHHHVGSAPSGVSFERHFGFFPESPEASFMGPVAFRGIGRNEGNFVLSMGSCASLNNGIALPGNMSENGSSSFRMRSSPRTGPVFLGGGDPFPGPVDGLIECGRSRRVDNNGNQIDSKRQYQLFLDKIVRGEDSRTTLMIKNIPNKYTSKMLLAAIDENHRGTYDFLYLPIDFKNKCNVGYAFINMISPSHIIPFYEAFNGKKWEKFNSEKVASLAYARIQGKAALVAHFQNSSLMNEDKRCRPILFHSEGTEADDTEPFLLNSINVRIRQHDGTSRDDLPESPHNSTSDEQPKNIEVGSSLREG